MLPLSVSCGVTLKAGVSADRQGMTSTDVSRLVRAAKCSSKNL